MKNGFNHKKHYDLLISTRKNMNRIKIKNDGYENHHIVPRSMCGNNSQENLVLLNSKEHFMAHYLLWMIYKNSKAAKAFWYMCTRGKHVYSARAYTAAKDAQLSLHRKWITKNEVYTTVAQAELDAYLHDGWILKRRPFNDKHIDNLRKSHKGVNLKKEHRLAISKGSKGIPKSESHRLNMLGPTSDDTKIKIGKPIVYMGITYPGIKWAATAFNTYPSFIRRKLENNKYQDCYFIKSS